MMNERFLAKTIELSTQAFQSDLDTLKQKSEESLTEYYNRVKRMMECVGAKDSSAITTEFLGTDPVEWYFKGICYGIKDLEVRKEAARELVSSNASLRSLAKSARCAQQEIRKLEDGDARIQELRYYKNLARERAQVDYL